MSDSYSGRPVDDPDGEAAYLDQEARDVADELDQAEALTRDRLAGGELDRRRAAIMEQVPGWLAHGDRDQPDDSNTWGITDDD